MNAVTKTWIGVSGGLWSVAGNWTPSGVPVAADDVIFNTNVGVNVDVGTPISLNSIAITTNATVTFNCNATKNFRLSSTSTLLPALLISAGCSLTVDGTNAGGNNSSLELTFGTGVIGSIYGTLAFSKTGGGASGINIDTYTSVTNYGILTVYSGGIIRINPNVGNTSSSLTPVPTVVMLNGSVFENLKNGGSFPNGTWEPNSLAIANSIGANGPLFNGNSYGNLEWNCPLQTTVSFFNKDISFNNVTLISTGSNNTPNAGSIRIKTGMSTGIWTMTVNGNLTIGTNSEISTTSLNTPSGSGGILDVNGDINNQGTITTYSLTGTTNDLLLSGTTNQSITNNGTFSGVILQLTMNNPAGATLNTPLTLPYNLTLTSGKITTTTPNLLTMVAGSSYTGGSITSFVDGPMKKIGNTNFTFPVGTGGIYAPIGIINGAGQLATDEFTAEYKRTNPQTPFGNQYGVSGINHVSYVEYWTLERDILSTATKRISLDVHPTSFCIKEATTFVSQFDGTFWTNETSTGGVFATCNAPYRCGTLTTNAPISNFTLTPSIFTLATTDPFATNPLPIKLINFSATKISNGLAVINWDLAECCSKFVMFELEKSTDSRNFVLLSRIDGSETNKFYFYNDSRLTKGTSYYRLKMTDADGSMKYSKVVAIVNEEKGFVITSIAPNPVQQTATLTISAAKQSSVDFKVYDVAGNLVKQWQSTIAAGNNVLNMDVAALMNGTYHVLASSADTRTVFRFLKQ